MFGVLTFRVYAIIAVCVSALCGAVAYFDTSQAFGGFFQAVGADAQPFLGGTITNFVFTPLELVFTNIYWAIGAGVLWPLLIIWFIFFMMALGATIVGPSLTELNNV